MRRYEPDVIEPHDQAQLRIAVEAAIARDRIDQAVELMRASPVGAKVLAEGFGGTYSDSMFRVSMYRYLMDERPNGVAELEAVLTGGIGGMSVAASMEAVICCSLMGTRLMTTRLGRTIYQPALSNPQAMAMLLRVDADRTVVDSHSDEGSPHLLCLSKAVSVLTGPSPAQEASLDLLVAAKAPLARSDDAQSKAAALKPFLRGDLLSLLDHTGAVRRVFSKYLDAGLLPIVGTTEWKHAGTVLTPLGACIFNECYPLAVELILRGCGDALSVDGSLDIGYWMRTSDDAKARSVVQEALMRVRVDSDVKPLTATAAPITGSVARRRAGL